VAVAMTTGHEAFVTPEDTQAMRDSGLAHVLSISGLHMAIVGGFVFFAVRLFIAAVPPIALRFPGKKIAAVAGLLAVGGYLVLSGAPAPAIRAAVTATVAFLAILLDRRAISLRALAVAALIVLALQPEAVAQPGFQMTFAATAALVALAEAWPPRTREINAPWPILAFQRSVAWLGAALGASLVAGLATTPFAVQHFNRVAVYALPANLATAPITSFLIMPALAVGAALAPLGLGGPFLWLAGFGRADAGDRPLRRRPAAGGGVGAERAGLGAGRGLRRGAVAVPVAGAAALARPAPGDDWALVADARAAEPVDRLGRGQPGDPQRRHGGHGEAEQQAVRCGVLGAAAGPDHRRAAAVPVQSQPLPARAGRAAHRPVERPPRAHRRATHGALRLVADGRQPRGARPPAARLPRRAPARCGRLRRRRRGGAVAHQFRLANRLGQRRPRGAPVGPPALERTQW